MSDSKVADVIAGIKGTVTLQDAWKLEEAVGENQDGKEADLVRQLHGRISTFRQEADPRAEILIGALVARGNEVGAMQRRLRDNVEALAIGGPACGLTAAFGATALSNNKIGLLVFIGAVLASGVSAVVEFVKTGHKIDNLPD